MEFYSSGIGVLIAVLVLAATKALPKRYRERVKNYFKIKGKT